MEKISHSEIKILRKCLRAWHYRYRERLQKKKPKRPAFVGVILHEMLDALARLRMPGESVPGPWDILAKYEKQYKALFQAEKEEFGDIPATVEAIFEGYMRRWKRDGLLYVASEIEFRVELLKGVELVGIIDKIVADPESRRFIMDHKFHRIIPGPDERFSDIQTVLYFWSWNESHKKAERVDGVLWDYGRMKAPAIPEVLKNGELSKRASIDTDVHTFRTAIRERGLKEKPYREFLKKLEGRERTFFERVPLPAPPKAMIQAVVNDARETAKLRKHIATDAPRSMSHFNCKTCDYRTVCEAEVRGLDAKFVRKRDYEIREHQERKGGKEIEEAA